MKNLFLTAVFLLSTLCVSAQKELSVESQYPGNESAAKVFLNASAKQSAERSALRTTWLANRPQDNWFISVKAGIGGIFNTTDGVSDLPSFKKPWDWFDSDKREGDLFWRPAAAINVGKWFSPVWGLRLDADLGDVTSFNQNKAIVNNRYWALTGNFLINVKELFLGYNPNSFFNPVLYLGMGAIHSNKPDQSKNYSDWNPFNKDGKFDITEKLGLQLNFRLSRSVDFFLDGSAWLVPADFIPTPGLLVASSNAIFNGEVGFTYKFNFRNFIKAPLYDPAEIDALLREINELRNRPATVCPPAPVCPPVPVCPPTTETKAEVTTELAPVFFAINSAVVRDSELLKVTKAAEYLASNPGSKIILKSYSDKKTGTPAYNLALSKKRGNAVADVLVKKFGIDKKRITLDARGDKEQPFPNNDQNRVTIFVK
ncbi:membrane protein [Bacteroidia bacterium]|nr:membrane protein [Bacteroidia bacterium]